MKKYYYSDLAVEGFGLKRNISKPYERSEKEYTDNYTEYEDNGVKVCRIRINGTEEARCGTYITAFLDKSYGKEEKNSDCIARLLREVLDTILDGGLRASSRILVVGLGNIDMTADSVGPRTMKKITVTGHLSHRDIRSFGGLKKCKIFAFSPGVMGDTGMESAKIIKGVISECEADAVIIVDSLAAKDGDRLINTVQISDNGISPGSGIYNPRCEISKISVGVPVIAVGVPTVVDSATLVCNALERAGLDGMIDELFEMLESQRGFFVSPKDCDIAVRNLSSLLALSIDKALSL